MPVYLPASDSQPDVVIVGGGPVGLATGIGLARHGRRVLILERHPHYSRTQYLRLDLCHVEDPDIKKALDLLIANKRADLDKEHQCILIGIQELEHCLQSIAKQKGIQIEQAHVKSNADIREAYPNCKFIIGADGARSIMRHSLFGDDDTALEKLQLRDMVQLTYQVRGHVKKLPRFRNWNTQIAIISVLGETTGGIVCNEIIKYHPDTDITDVTLGFLVHGSIYNDKRLKNAVAKSPIPLTKNIPPQLFHAINRWLNERGDKNYIDGTQKLNKTQLQVYRAKRAYHEDNNAVTFLIGDAYAGLPYQNGLNVGLACSNQLVAMTAANKPAVIADQYHEIAKKMVAEKTKKVLKTDNTLTLKKVAVSAYYATAAFPINIGAAFHDDDHSMFKTGNESRYRWLWIIAGTLIFTAIAAAFTFTFGAALPALAIAAILINAAGWGFVAGYRAWKAYRSHTDSKIEKPPLEQKNTKQPIQPTTQNSHASATRPITLPRSQSSYNIRDYAKSTSQFKLANEKIPDKSQHLPINRQRRNTHH